MAKLPTAEEAWETYRVQHHLNVSTRLANELRSAFMAGFDVAAAIAVMHTLERGERNAADVFVADLSDPRPIWEQAEDRK